MTHGERLVAATEFHRNTDASPKALCRRVRGVSAAVLTNMASTAAVCLMDSAARWLRHHKLQSYADDADPPLKTFLTTRPPTEARAERMTSPAEKSRNTLCDRRGQKSDAVPQKEFHNDRTPQGYCDHRDIYRRIKKRSATNRLIAQALS